MSLRVHYSKVQASGKQADMAIFKRITVLYVNFKTVAFISYRNLLVFGVEERKIPGLRVGRPGSLA